MQNSYQDEIFKPLREPGWLTLILVRLFIGASSGVIGVINNLFLFSKVFSLSGSTAGLSLTVLLAGYSGTIALIIADMVLFLKRKKQFIPMYIVTMGVIATIYFIGMRPELGCMILMVESFVISGLLISKRAALRFGFYNRFSRAALDAFAVRTDVGKDKEAALEEMEDAAFRYGRNTISREEFSEIKCRSLAKL